MGTKLQAHINRRLPNTCQIPYFLLKKCLDGIYLKASKYDSWGSITHVMKIFTTFLFSFIGSSIYPINIDQFDEVYLWRPKLVVNMEIH